MESLFSSLVSLERIFKQAGLESIAIGALALSVWGKARLTRDIDVKILLGRDEAARLVKALPSDYVLLSDEPAQTLERLGMLFVRDPGGNRIDILLSDVEFDVSAVKRFRKVEVRPGVSARFCSPEDLIIYKLISTRPQDHADAESVIRRQGNTIDEEYILYWLKRFEQALDDSTLLDKFRLMRQAG
ncbi:MAG: hypothetical protein HYU64_21980 [Armatimonadetes bacterium]|nr:hypothetical protein [Armatimonadota bacterium]